MIGEVEIIHLSPENWNNYKKLRLRALKTEPQAFGKSYKDSKREPDEMWENRLKSSGLGKRWSVFAQLKGKLIGMIEAAIHPDESDKVWLHATYIDKKYRGRGIASKLMEQIVSDVAQCNVPKRLKLGVNKKQKAAISLYKRSGFKIISEQDQIMGNGQKVREFIMERQLEK